MRLRGRPGHRMEDRARIDQRLQPRAMVRRPWCTGSSRPSSTSRLRSPAYSCSARPSGRCCTRGLLRHLRGIGGEKGERRLRDWPCFPPGENRRGPTMFQPGCLPCSQACTSPSAAAISACGRRLQLGPEHFQPLQIQVFGSGHRRHRRRQLRQFRVRNGDLALSHWPARSGTAHRRVMKRCANSRPNASDGGSDVASSTAPRCSRPWPPPRSKALTMRAATAGGSPAWPERGSR